MVGMWTVLQLSTSDPIKVVVLSDNEVLGRSRLQHFGGARSSNSVMYVGSEIAGFHGIQTDLTQWRSWAKKGI
jgi:hypothetical protein